MDTHLRLHGTTTDKFTVGNHSFRLIFNELCPPATSKNLTTKSEALFELDTSVFFSAYIIGKGSNYNAAYEIKGCRRSGQIIDGYVINTYINSDTNVSDPEISFTTDNKISILCYNDTSNVVEWSAVVDCVVI